jgi:GDP-L-fucose synthase
MEFKDKRVLITGANGLVGLPLVKKCLDEGAFEVIAVDIKIGKKLESLKEDNPNRLTLSKKDLTYLHNCESLFPKKVDIVLHIAGIKGSPSRTKKCPADYLFPMNMFNMNMIQTSFNAGVDWFVYMSSVGVYSPADVMEEDTVWNTMPSKNDWHPGWTKRMGELALESLKIQYGWDKWTIIRPSNIYGIDDNFSQDATVIGANIWKLFNTDGDLVCWGDGSAKRDFVFGDDVAQATIDVVKKEINDVINFGCGEAVSIKDTIETIVFAYKEITGNKRNIVWDESKPTGDKLRCLSDEKQKKYGVLPTTLLKDGILKSVMAYRDKYHSEIPRNFDSLHKTGFYFGHISEIIKTNHNELTQAIDRLKYLAENKRSECFKYRHSVAQNGYSYIIPVDEIDQRKNEVKEKRLEVTQQWYETSDIYYPPMIKYFEELLDSFIRDIYPEVESFNYNQSFSLYEDGDFISDHADGQNKNRLCVVLIYLSDYEDYNNGGGNLILTLENNTKKKIPPIKGNYVILDFLNHNLRHEVEPVKNGFKRYCYISFVYKKEKL